MDFGIIRTFDQLKSLKKFGQVIKYETFIIKTFNQVKKHNFDQVNFGQVIISHKKLLMVTKITRTVEDIPKVILILF